MDLDGRTRQFFSVLSERLKEKGFSSRIADDGCLAVKSKKMRGKEQTQCSVGKDGEVYCRSVDFANISRKRDLESILETVNEVHSDMEPPEAPEQESTQGGITLGYPNSHSEAHRLGEATLWDASFHANVSCARDIEAVIRVYGDGRRSALKPEASQTVLKRWGFKRTNFVLANTIERLGPYKEQLSTENQEWQKKVYVPPDDAHNRYFEVDTALAYLDAFISQVREAYGKLELFGPEHCEPNSYESLDYEGRVLGLSPDTLKESCWTPQNQLWLAHDGFGCRPRAIGRSIRCTCLGDGEMTRWNRTDFTGVLKEKFLPGWAKEKLDALQEQNAGMGGMNMT